MSSSEGSVNLQEILQDSLSALPSKTVFIALSGGLDSMVLLHVAASLPEAYQIQAIHINHGLSPNSPSWERFCQQQCESLGIALRIQQVTVESSGQGLEAAARQARYRVFEDVLVGGGVLLQGHHQNDQAETVLLRLLRGEGPEGLAAIPRQRPLAKGHLVRPFLNLSRSVLRAWAECHGVEWIYDESNDDVRFDRNFIRHQILPLLQQRWPAVLDNLQHSAEKSARWQQWRNQQTAELLQQSDCLPARDMISIVQLKSVARFQAEAMVQTWLQKQGMPFLPAAMMQRLWTELIPAADDAGPMVQWGGHCLRRFGEYLVACAAPAEMPQSSLTLCLETIRKASEDVQVDWGDFRIRLRYLKNTELVAGAELQAMASAVLPLSDDQSVQEAIWQIRHRPSGGKFRVIGDRHQRLIKKYLQQWGVFPWMRDRLPFIYRNGELVNIAGRWARDGEIRSVGCPAIMIVVECDRTWCLPDPDRTSDVE